MAKKGRRNLSRTKKEPFEGRKDDVSSDEEGSLKSYQSSRAVDSSNEEDATSPQGIEENADYVDDFEDKLVEAFDTLMDASSLQGRLNTLGVITKAFTSRYLFDFVNDRKLTIMDMIERSLRRPKGTEELAYASTLAALTCITMGPSDEMEILMRETKSILLTLASDATLAPSTKSRVVQSLGVITFITDDSTSSSVLQVMDAMASIFAGSFHKGNGVVPTVTPILSALHASALNVWTLLLTTCSIDTVIQMSDRWSGKISQLLDSSDVDLRMSAGETLATIHEILINWNADFELNNCDELLAKLQSLATDSSKHRAKRDRRLQRSTFRDVVKLIEGDADERSINEVIKFGRERLVIETFCMKRQYESFCNILGSGMSLHLAVNDLLRDIFSLGEVIITDAGSRATGNGKLPKFERHMENLAIARARTKTRGKLRDKRIDAELGD